MAGTWSRGHIFAFLFALGFFFFVFLFVLVFDVLPVASGSWLLLRLWLRIVFILLPLASGLWAPWAGGGGGASLLPVLWLWLPAASCLLPARGGPGMLGTRGCQRETTAISLRAIS